MDYIRYLREMVGAEPVIMVGAGVILFDDTGKLLMQRRADGGMWGLIGGYMELGETPEAAARREVFEETGLSVGGLELFGVFSTDGLWTYPSGDQVQIITVMFLTDGVTGTLEPDSEGLELRFFDLEALPEPIFPPALPMLEAVKERFRGSKA